jgi:hypothetical protein
MKQVHDARQLCKPGTEAREVKQHYPGPEQIPKNKRMENEPQVVEDVLPTLPGVPSAMRRETLHLWSLGRGRACVLLAGLQSRTVETDQGVGAEPQSPPAFNRGLVCDAVVCPP